MYIALWWGVDAVLGGRTCNHARRGIGVVVVYCGVMYVRLAAAVNKDG